MLDALIGTGGKIVDRLFGVQDRRAGEDFARWQMAENANLQREFGQNAIQWKVADAKKAGVHPLYALGANTTSFSPISVSSPDAGKTDFGSLGQDLSRASMANRSVADRTTAHQEALNKLMVEGKSLENEVLRQKLRGMKSQVGPAVPDVGPVPEAKEYEDRPKLSAGEKWDTNPWWVNAEDVEKRYGDLVQELYGVGTLMADGWYNIPKGYFTWDAWKKRVKENDPIARRWRAIDGSKYRW